MILTKYLVYCLWMLLLPIAAFSQQEEKELILPFALNLEGQDASTIYNENFVATENAHKYYTAKRVFDQLVTVKGNTGITPPKFELSNGKKYIAYVKPNTGIIGIETTAYDLCTSFGRDSLDALAFLLAHEMIHYYQRHGWYQVFEKENQNLTVTKTINKVSYKTSNEIQADYEGGILAFMTGYDPLYLLSELFKKLYNHYNFRAQPIGYPSLEERIQIAKQSQIKLKELVDIFETANYLLALGNYMDAKSYYAKVALAFPSKEIFNNIGVSSTLAATDYFTKSEFPYIMPLELDLNSRLYNRTRSTFDINFRKQKREALLLEALKAFQQALAIDDAYLEANLNIGCVYLLQEQYRKARFYAEEALAKAVESENKNIQSKAYVLLGILEAMEGVVDAKANFEKAVSIETSTLADINRKIFENSAILGKFSPTSNKEAEVEEQIANIPLGQLQFSLEYDQSFQISDSIKLLTKEIETSNLLIHFINESNFTLMHHTNPEYAGRTAKNITIGDTLEKVLSQYGQPSNQIHSTSGLLLIYPAQRLIFSLDKEERIKSWGVYKQVIF